MKSSASGLYRYWCNGEDSGVSESWSLQRDDSLLTLHSERLARPIGVSIQVDSRQLAGAFQHCCIQWRQEHAAEQHQASADYHFDTDLVRVERDFDGETLPGEDLVQDFIFSPLMRIYNGPVITALAEAGEDRRVCVPTLSAKPEAGTFLGPLFSQRRAKELDRDTLQIDDRQRDCTRYEYSGGEYAPGTEFWIDDTGVMLRYCWQQDSKTQWDVRLENYRPE